MPGVVYAAGVRHAYNLAEAFRDEGLKAQAVSGETPKRELATILARYERGDIDVLINAQLLAEGWNSPRATVCVHLAPTASKRIYQQRVGRVTRRHPGKEAGLVVDFVHPATKHDDPVVTLHSLLDRDVYRGGAIVVGPVRRGRGRRVRVERRVLPVCPEPERRAEVFERELWRIAVEHLDYGEQHVWAALAGARVQANGWRRARAMLHFDRDGELRRRFLITAVQRNPNPPLRLKALAEIAAARDPDAFDSAIDIIGTWTREERREGAKIMLQAMVERRIGRRDQANAWIWRIAEYTRDVHEEYAVAALAGDQAAARPARQLLRRGARAQRAAPRARRAQAGPPARGGAARGGARAHAGGRGGAARRAHADGAQAAGAGARAAAQLPQAPRPRQAAPPARQGDGNGNGETHAVEGGGSAATLERSVDSAATLEQSTAPRARRLTARGVTARTRFTSPPLSAIRSPPARSISSEPLSSIPSARPRSPRSPQLTSRPRERVARAPGFEQLRRRRGERSRERLEQPRQHQFELAAGEPQRACALAQLRRQLAGVRPRR